MAEGQEEPEAPDRLQFERVENAGAPPPQPLCQTCRQPVYGAYYDVGGAMMCERCRHDLQLAGAGGGAGRLGRAILFGVLATVACSVGWYVIRKLTGYEFGILAIGVGLLVGGAVRAGGRGRGGWRYQALAMFLTYNAIVVTYVPDIVKGLQAAPPAPATPTVSGATPVQPVSDPAPGQPASKPPSAGVIALALVFLLLVAYAAPFLALLHEPRAVMGLVIIGIALYEAWKMNRRQVLEITGPHQLGSPGAVPPSSAAGP